MRTRAAWRALDDLAPDGTGAASGSEEEGPASEGEMEATRSEEPEEPGVKAPPVEGTIGRRALSATAALVAAQVISIVIAFAGVKIITNSVGADLYGIYATCISFTAIFALLADFGVNAVTSREVASAPERASDIVPFSIGLRLLLSLVVAPIVLIFSFLVYPNAQDLLHLGVGLIAAGFIPDAIRAILFGYLTATSRNHWIAYSTVGQQVLFLAGTVIAVISSSGLLGVFLSYLFASVFTTTAVALVVGRGVRVLPRISVPHWRKLLVMSLSVGAIQVINMLYLRVDALMLSVLVGPTAVGVYAVAYSVINGAAAIPGYLMSSLLPGIVSLERHAREALLNRAMEILAVMGALLVGALALSATAVVQVISSPEFDGAAAPLVILGVGTFFTFVNPVFGFSSVALNVHHRIVWISLGGLLLNVVLNLAMVPVLGVSGAAFATLMCEALSFVATFISFRKSTGLRVAIVRPLLTAATIVGITLTLGGLLNPDRLPSPLLLVLLSGVEALAAGALVISFLWVAKRVRLRAAAKAV